MATGFAVDPSKGGMRLLFLSGLLLAISPSVAAAAPPHLSGTVSIDLHRGSLAGDMCVSGLHTSPPRFALNKGLNIESVRTTTGEIIPYAGYYDLTVSGDGIAYVVRGNSADSFCVRYVGAFPIYHRPTNTFDFKGMIAVNDRTLRATEQSAWYPRRAHRHRRHRRRRCHL